MGFFIVNFDPDVKANVIYAKNSNAVYHHLEQNGLGWNGEFIEQEFLDMSTVMELSHIFSPDKKTGVVINVKAAIRNAKDNWKKNEIEMGIHRNWFGRIKNNTFKA